LMRLASSKVQCLLESNASATGSPPVIWRYRIQQRDPRSPVPPRI